MAFIPMKEENEGVSSNTSSISRRRSNSSCSNSKSNPASFIVQCQALFALSGYSYFTDGETEDQSGCIGSDSEYTHSQD